MTSWVPTDNTNPAGAGAIGDLVMSANQGINAVFWCPTFRPLANSGSFTIYQPNDTERTTQTVYMKGLKEVTTLRVAGGTPWRRRRIVFSAKGMPARFGTIDPLFTSAFYQNQQTSIGVTRLTNPLRSDAATALSAFLFKGQGGVDWNSVFNAKTDDQFFKIHSDRTIVLNGGNTTGMTRTLRDYYPFNKNMIFDDDENGISMGSTGFANQGRPGMGDVYIVDYYQSTLTTASDQLAVNHEATLYFHEK